jgi:hypothetical protein
MRSYSLPRRRRRPGLPPVLRAVAETQVSEAAVLDAREQEGLERFIAACDLLAAETDLRAAGTGQVAGIVPLPLRGPE